MLAKPARPGQLFVENLVTGDRRTWTGTTCHPCTTIWQDFAYSYFSPGVLSWAADNRTLAFETFGGGSAWYQVRLLNVDDRSPDLTSASQLAATSSR